MCLGCKYSKNGDCEFLLTPETCHEFDLGDKFEEEKIIPLAITQESEKMQGSIENKNQSIR